MKDRDYKATGSATISAFKSVLERRGKMPPAAIPVSTTVLKSVPLFASVPDEQLRALVPVVTRRSALLDVYGRVARLLLDMSEDVNGQKMLTKRLPKQDIAKMIGASREMVSRVMKDLQMSGYIEVRGSTIVLRDTIMLRH